MRIGTYSVRMTPEQVSRWNAGESTEADLAAATVHIPRADYADEEVSLLAAMEGDPDQFVGPVIDTEAAIQ